MKIASWNINSINVRQTHVAEWVAKHQPDFLFLQELKCETDKFPSDLFGALGYHAHVLGQKTYNGVAVLTKHPNCDIRYGLPGDESDLQARFVEVNYNDMVLIGMYAPNGNPVEGEKYLYKLSWYDRLIAHIGELLKTHEKILVTGDFNIIPEDADCYDPIAWAGDALFTQASRDKFYTLKHMGFEDAYRVLHKNEVGAYSFWDYQKGAWQKNLGIRIDHFLTSGRLTDRIVSCEFDKDERAKERPSDHVPVILELETI